MKLKVKIKSPYEIKITSKGDWFDLKYTGPDTVFDGFENVKTNYTDAEGKKHYKKRVTPKVQLLDLGVAMQLPKGFEAIVAPRSSTPKHYGILCANSIGVIDGKLFIKLTNFSNNCLGIIDNKPYLCKKLRKIW